MARRRKTEAELAELIYEYVHWLKITEEGVFIDLDPFVAVAHLVTHRIGAQRLLSKPKARCVWRLALEALQASDGLEHNSFIACRFCDVEFEPMIDETLLTLCLKLDDTMATDDLLKIHRCPTCGGTLRSLKTRHYTGDGFIPAPGSVKDDDEWAQEILFHPAFGV